MDKFGKQCWITGAQIYDELQQTEEGQRQGRMHQANHKQLQRDNNSFFKMFIIKYGATFNKLGSARLRRVLLSYSLFLFLSLKN
jgi:hypothetical protein